MSRKLVGWDKAWTPQALLNTKAPQRFTPNTNINQRWAGQNPYFRPQDQLGAQAGVRNPTLQALANYNKNAASTLASANLETGQKYLAANPVYATGAPQQLGSPQMTNIHARVPIADGSMVSIPLNAAMGGYPGIATPEDLARKYRNAQLIQGGFGPLEGLLGVGMFGLGLPGGVFSNLIGRLSPALQGAIKVGGGLKSAADLVTSKGRSGASTLLNILGSA